MTEDTVVTAAAADAIALTPSQRRYQTIVDKIFDLCRGAEQENMKRYYRIGEKVFEFLGKDEENEAEQAEKRKKRYGDATVENLAEDLQSKGALTDIKDPKRFLYWACNLFGKYEWEQLEELTARGFTMTHAKLLMGVSPEIENEVKAEMLVDGRVIGTRAMEDLIREKQQARIAGEAAAAAEAAEEGRPVEAEEGTSVDAIKVLTTMAKSLVRLQAEVPNAFIGIREIREVGFGSDKRYEKYIKLLREVDETMEAANEPLAVLRKEITDELAEIEAAERTVKEG